MNSKNNKIKYLALLLMLFIPLSAFINAIISGDVVVAGGDLFIGHHVKGDVIAAGGSILLRGDILDDVRTAGGNIVIDATIGDDLIASGGRINISSDSTINGNAWLAGVKLEGGEIEILEGSIIHGDLNYSSPHEAVIHDSAQITGKVSYEQTEWQQPHRGTGIIFVLTMIVASIVLLKSFPGFTMSSVSRISAEPLKSLGAGFLTLVVIPLVAGLMMAIVLELWVGLSIMAVYLVALILGFVVACFSVADWGARRLNKDINSTRGRLFSVSLVIIALGLIRAIPVIGGLFMFLLLLAGLGGVILQLKDNYQQQAIPQ